MTCASLKSEDAAWVRIETALDPSRLRVLLDDVERLFRINPLLEIASFAVARTGAEGAGATIEADRFHMTGRNLSNGRDFDLHIRVTRRLDGLDIAYDSGLKSRTILRIEPVQDCGAGLVVTDEYDGASQSEKQARLAEVDRSLTDWGRGLRIFFNQWHRWSWIAPWRWYMRRIWLPCRASSRRIVWLIWVVSTVELMAFLILVALWRAA